MSQWQFYSYSWGRWLNCESFVAAMYACNGGQVRLSDEDFFGKER